MTTPTYDIAVIGCGSGGPAAATFLARQGHRVTVFERVPELGPVGAGFLLQPTGLSVLEELGCLEPVLAHGGPVTQLLGQTSTGRTILDLRYKDLQPGLFGLGMHRAVLLHFLQLQMEEAGVDLRCGIEIKTLQSDSKGQTTLLDAQEETHGPFDLVIVADGARSGLRDQLGIPTKVRPYEWGALWYIGEDVGEQFPGRLFQIFEGTKKLVGFLPTGHLVDQDTPQVSLFWSIRLDQIDAWQTRGLEAWRQDVLRYVPQAEAYLAQIQSPDQLLQARYFDVSMPYWHTPSAVILGDAAHAMSPQLGQGVNLALFDAMVLAQCVADTESIAQATATYSRRRKRHLRFYQWATRAVTPFFQSDLPLISPIVNIGRDLIGPILQTIRPFRLQMIRSMAGVKRGILRRSFPIPTLPSGSLPAHDTPHSTDN